MTFWITSRVFNIITNEFFVGKQLEKFIGKQTTVCSLSLACLNLNGRLAGGLLFGWRTYLF
jgi:hypothetical protein